MYVCLRQLSMYVCMSQTYIHTLSDFCVKSSLQRVWICSKTLCFVMKMKHTYMLKSLRNSNITVTHQEAPNYVCMFEILVFCRDKWNIHTYLTSRHFLLMICFFESVCFKTSCFVVLYAHPTQRASSFLMASWGSSESNTHRYYINTSIHTYIPSFRPSH